MLTPQEIQARDFLVSLRGYDRDEVAAFLAQVADEVGRLQDRIAELQAQPPPAPEPAPAAAASAEHTAMFAEIGQQTQRILEAAQTAGEELKRGALQEADRERKEARAEATQVIADGERRREAAERAVAQLDQARAEVAEDLRAVGRTLEQVLRELAPAPVATVREALAAEVAADAAAGEDPAALPHEDPAPALQEDPAPRDGPAPLPQGAKEPVPRDAPAPLPKDAGPLPQEDPSPPQDPAPAPQEPASHAAGTDPMTLRDHALSPLQPKLVRALKRALQELQNAVLDTVRRNAGDARTPDELLPSAAELDGLAGLAGPLLDQAFEQGVIAAALLAEGDLESPPARTELEQGFAAAAGELVVGQLAATLRVGQSAGDDPSALSDRVGAVFGELKGSQAEDLAAGHLISAYELGLLDAWKAGGISARRWVVGKEPRCPEGRCRSNDQAGDIAIGSLFPSGHEVPPVHVGCTCTTVPVNTATDPANP